MALAATLAMWVWLKSIDPYLGWNGMIEQHG